MKHKRDTTSRILDVAEELFGEQGLDRVSIRDITRKAKVNLAKARHELKKQKKPKAKRPSRKPSARSRK